MVIPILAFLASSALAAESARPLTREEVQARFARAVETSRSSQVVYQDVLGEGRGFWDDDPRFPDRTTNCITWLHSIVTDIYGQTEGEKRTVMDRLRYFKGKVGFGTRKHFLDQHLTLEPAPFKKMDLSSCGKLQRRKVKIQPQFLAKSLGYACPLYGEKQNQLDVEYVSPSDFVKCAGTFEPGFYVFNAVATPKYLRRYGPVSGPMGYVHALVLRVGPPSKTGSKPLTLHHASILTQKVMTEPLEGYLVRTLGWYAGFMSFELDPSWDFTAPFDEDDEMKGVLQCEQRLVGKGKKRDRARDFLIGE